MGFSKMNNILRKLLKLELVVFRQMFEHFSKGIRKICTQYKRIFKAIHNTKSYRPQQKGIEVLF